MPWVYLLLGSDIPLAIFAVFATVLTWLLRRGEK